MAKHQLKIGSESTINIERCNGRVNLQGTSKAILSYSDDDDVSVLQDGSYVNVLAEFDFKAYVPKNAPVVVQHVEDKLYAKELRSLRIDWGDYDVKVSDLQEALTIGSVSGDLEVKKAAGIFAKSIEGDTSVKFITGDIKIAKAVGDFSVRGCSGKIEVADIEGDVFLSSISGVVKLDSVDGDVVIQGALPAEKHHIIGSGDVIVYWPLDQNVQFLVTHKGDLVNQMRLPNETSNPNEFQATLGDDSCRLIIETDGDVYLRPLQTEKQKTKNIKKTKRKEDFDIDFEDLLDPEELIEKIGDGIKSMVMLQKRNKGKGLLNKIFGKAMRDVDEWAGVPQEREAKSNLKQPQSDSSEEERRIILKMLENGSITVDEATERLKRL